MFVIICNSIYDVQAVHAEKGMQEEEKQDDLSTLNAFKRHNWVAYQFLQQWMHQPTCTLSMCLSQEQKQGGSPR